METKTRSGWLTAMIVLVVLVAVGLLAWLFAAAIFPLVD